VRAEEEQSTDTFNSMVFYTNSAVDFGIIGTFDTVSDFSMTMSVMVWDEMTGRHQNIG
jgi:hypothetical protein